MIIKNCMSIWKKLNRKEISLKNKFYKITKQDKKNSHLKILLLSIMSKWLIYSNQVCLNNNKIIVNKFLNSNKKFKLYRNSLIYTKIRQMSFNKIILKELLTIATVLVFKPIKKKRTNSRVNLLKPLQKNGKLNFKISDSRT